MRYDDDKGKKTGIIEERIIQPSTLEVIDQSMYDWVDEKLNIFCGYSSRLAVRIFDIYLVVCI